MNARFDDVCRLIATPLPRRRLFRLMAGALVGGAVGLRPREARGDVLCPGTKVSCKTLDLCCHAAATEDGLGCKSPCTNDRGQVVFVCCPPATPVNCCCEGNCCQTAAACCSIQGVCDCCPGNQECCHENMKTACCPPDKPACCNGGLCCKSHAQCCTHEDRSYECCPDDQKCCSGACCPGPNKDPQSAYNVQFGGTYVSHLGTKSITQMCECGLGHDPGGTSVTADTFQGLLEGYDYASRTLFGPVTFDSLQGEVFDDGDVVVMALGSGQVNGVPTDITLMASATAGLITYSLMNSNTLKVIAGGTGLSGDSALELTITPP